MSSKRTWVDYLGPVFGMLAAAMVVGALVYLLGIEPFYRRESYPSFDRDRGDLRGALGWESQEVVETVEEEIRALEIKNVSGPILIEGWDRDYAQVYYLKQARTLRYLEEFEIEIETRGKRLHIRPIYRNVSGSPFGSVSFEVKAPASIREIEANNISGNITIENMGEGVGQVLGTVSGSIDTQRSGNLKARSVSGSIRFSASGGTLDINSTSGRVHGEILSLGPEGSVDIDTISGAVELEAFADLDAELDLRSVSGSINCEFPVQIAEQKRNRLTGTIGRGTVPFSVSTVSGGIRLDR